MPATRARAGTRCCFCAPPTSTARPAELAAARAGEPVAEYCKRMHGVQARLAEGFRLSFDHFGRSSSSQNHRLTQHFAGRLADRGLIEERAERQVYSVADGRFLPDRYVEGTCPNCGFRGRARGPVRQLHQAARPGGADRPALGDLGRHRSGVPRDAAPPSAAVEAQGRDRGVDRRPRGLAGADHLDREEVAARRRRPAGPGHHARPRLGHPGAARGGALAGDGGQGLLRLVRRADRVHRLRAGVGGRGARVRTGPAGGGTTGARRTCATCSSWARTTCPSTR